MLNEQKITGMKLSNENFFLQFLEVQKTPL